MPSLTLAKMFPFPVSGNEVNVSPGRRFMIDLLVGSLMADGGLESALNAAITAEIQVQPACPLAGRRAGHPVLWGGNSKPPLAGIPESPKQDFGSHPDRFCGSVVSLCKRSCWGQVDTRPSLYVSQQVAVTDPGPCHGSFPCPGKGLCLCTGCWAPLPGQVPVLCPRSGVT